MMNIGNREIGRDTRPYLIAEMSGNHNQSLDRALKIVSAAAEAGADAVKLQTYTPDTMTLNVDAPGFVIEDPESLWAGRQLYELYGSAHTPWDWHKPIMDHARSLGIQCFSTPFDESSVAFLEELDVPAYKIASFEMTDLPLVTRVAQTGKPMIVSTGMASIAEIDEMVRAVRATGNDQIIILKCTSSYPATPENSNVATIPNMRDTFGVEVGLSDHSMGCGVAVASVALGAVLIEKHFTLRRADGGVDSVFSLEPAEFRILRDETERAWQSVGQVAYGCTSEDAKSRVFRRSLYIAEDLKAGDSLTPHTLRRVRPGYGMEPKYYHAMLGRKVKEDVTKGTPLSLDLLM